MPQLVRAKFRISCPRKLGSALLSRQSPSPNFSVKNTGISPLRIESPVPTLALRLLRDIRGISNQFHRPIPRLHH